MQKSCPAAARETRKARPISTTSCKMQREFSGSERSKNREWPQHAGHGHSYQLSVASLRRECVGLRRHDHHPADAETVDQHAEALREERLAERHCHLAALGERGELAIGLG